MMCRYSERRPRSSFVLNCVIEDPLKSASSRDVDSFYTGVAGNATRISHSASVQLIVTVVLLLIKCVIWDRTALAVDPLFDSECLWNGSSLAAGFGSGRKVGFILVLTHQNQGLQQAWGNYKPRVRIWPVRIFSPAH